MWYTVYGGGILTTGERIKQARKQAGMTQKELAKKLGISYVGVSQWENNLRNPKQETIQRIADAIGCDFYWLLWGEKLSTPQRISTNVMRMFCSDDPHVKKAAELAAYYTETDYKKKGYSFTQIEERLIFIFSQLNLAGQQKALERVEELTEIPKYQRTEENK